MEEEQALIGSTNLSTSSSVDPNQNPTKKKKKGYGFAAFLLALLLSAALITGQYIAGSDSGINSNSNSNSNNLMDGSASLTMSTNEGSSQQERGLCLEDGDYTDVVPYKHHKKVLPGAIYNGLDFTDDSFRGSIEYQDCGKSYYYGDGRPVGDCMRHEDSANNHTCPQPQTHIVEGWKLCAKYCNDDPDCYTFTVHARADLGRRDYACYFHKSYSCQSGGAGGIANYVAPSCAGKDNCGVWSGICRTASGSRPENYACTDTPPPIPKPGELCISKNFKSCRACGDGSCCCKGGTKNEPMHFSFHCCGI